MKKLYAYRGGCGKENWEIYIHADTLAVMKGKLNNVGLHFSSDRTHVMIFSMTHLVVSSGGRIWMGNRSLDIKRICFIKDGEVTSVCEVCNQYVSCVGTNFRKCRGLPKIDLTKEAIMDLSLLTFVGPNYAKGLPMHWPEGILGQMNLTEEGITERRETFKERAQLGSHNRAYKKSTCSQCVMNCLRVRPQPDMAITEELVTSVYDVFANILFDGSLLYHLKWCKRSNLAIDSEQYVSSKERELINCLFDSERSWGEMTVCPIYGKYFSVSVGNSCAIIELDDVKRIVEPNSHIDKFICQHRNQFLYSYGITGDLYGSCYYYYSHSRYNVSSAFSALVQGSRTDRDYGNCIPGTSVPVVHKDRVCTRDEILAQAEDEAKKLLAYRQALLTLSHRPSSPYSAEVSTRDQRGKAYKEIDTRSILRDIG